MSTKSHRAKALAAQLSSNPTSSTLSTTQHLGDLVPPESLVKPKKKKSSSKRTGKESVKDGVLGSALKGKERAVEVEEDERPGLGEEEDDAEVLVAQPNSAEDDDAMVIDAPVPAATSSDFVPLTSTTQRQLLLKPEERRVPIPPHRMTPLKRDWVNIYGPLVEMMGLMVRMNVGRKCVELRTSKHTPDQGAIQKGADFIKAYALGFDVKDAIAILRLEDLYVDSFEIKDVKTLHGDHLSRAIGRIAGQDGKTRFTIENAARVRIVLADTHIHILGSVQNIKIARDAIVSLILGSPPGKVYAHLRAVGARLKQRF